MSNSPMFPHNPISGSEPEVKGARPACPTCGLFLHQEGRDWKCNRLRCIKQRGGDVKARTLQIKVAGVTFDGRQDLIRKLRGDEEIRIVPEPLNKFDRNALAVRATLKDGTDAHLGYVPRALAAQIAPVLDGDTIMIEIAAITGGFTTSWGEEANLGLQIVISLPKTD